MSFWNAFLNKKHCTDNTDELIQSVEYQLCALFSSEAPLTPISHRFIQARQSNHCYGLESIQSISSQMHQDEFTRYIRKLVHAFEPRLTQVNVEVFERDEKNNRINFSLTAQLNTQMGTRIVEFDSNINLADQGTEIEGQDIV